MNARCLLQAFMITLLLSCSCKTSHYAQGDLPTEVSFNNDAGRGNEIFVTVRLNNGGEKLFAVDTGMPVTVLDESLSSELGRCIDTNEWSWTWYGKRKSWFYKAPNLYLGNRRLATGDRILTEDLKQIFDRSNMPRMNAPISGILGMDCLQHYCIQLDFDANKMRFFAPDNLKTENFGEAFPLTIATRGDSVRIFVNGTLVGTKGLKSWIDTGDPNDGALVPTVFKRELQSQNGVRIKTFKLPSGQSGIGARLPNGHFGREGYTNLIVLESSDGNIVGLRFLSRHLVTFNFPERMMYLKRESIGPLADEKLEKPPNTALEPTPTAP